MNTIKTIFDKSTDGRVGIKMPINNNLNTKQPNPKLLRKNKASLPSLSEFDVVRHYTNLSSKNFSIDKNFYPLGSCTMKYNPKICERVASLDGFLNSHPHHITNKNTKAIKGCLQVTKELQDALCDISGMSAFSTMPQAGAHGEMLGLMMISKYHKHKAKTQNKPNTKKYIIVPDSSHGTNPATASMVGYEVIVIKSDANGIMNYDDFKEKINDEVAGVMLTVPNTLGIFNNKIKQICELAHSFDALMYYDGANLNAIMGVIKPGEIGFDVMHINVHKTFATPHGGGGPGSGPVGVSKTLEPFLPKLCVNDDLDIGDAPSLSVGNISPFFGNFAISLRALVYIRALGANGIVNASKKAVLNANYLRVALKPYLNTPYDCACMHEFVLSAKDLLKEHNVSAMDLAKYLIDFQLHAPTVYFPLIVSEAIMIEPTESENKQTLDYFISKIKEAISLAKTNPDEFKNYPKTLGICRPDDTKAVRELDIRATCK